MTAEVTPKGGLGIQFTAVRHAATERASPHKCGQPRPRERSRPVFLLRAPARHKNYPTDTRDVSETMSVEGSKHTHEPPLPLHRSSQFIGQNRFGECQIMTR